MNQAAYFEKQTIPLYGYHYELGRCYYYGLGVPQNIEKALYWYQRIGKGAYENERAFARKYFETYGAPTQAALDSAVARYGPAMREEGIPEAFLPLACYAQEGDAKAQYDLAECYEGLSIIREDCLLPWDHSLAMKWYQRSAEQEYAPAQFRLSGLYFLDHNDLEKNAYWYKKAASNGFPVDEDFLALLNDES